MNAKSQILKHGAINLSNEATAGVFTNNSDNAETIYADNTFGTSSDPINASVISAFLSYGDPAPPVGSTFGNAVSGVADNSGNGIYGSAPTGSGYAGYFDGDVTVTGAMVVLGSKSGIALVKNQSGNPIGLSTEEATGEWVSDYNTGTLSNGITIITIPADYLYTVNAQNNYYVFLQPEGDCKGLYVNNKTATTFEVKELQGGTSNINFSYRIMGKRKGFENLRLPNQTQIQQASSQNLQTVWPEILTQRQNMLTRMQQKSAKVASVPVRSVPSLSLGQPSVPQIPSQTSSTPPQPLPGTPDVVSEQGDQ
ncbi:MAG: hypothetical protein ABIT08_05760 [Bacteroidia bacterium]